MFVNDRFQLNTKSYLPSLQNYEKKRRKKHLLGGVGDNVLIHCALEW